MPTLKDMAINNARNIVRQWSIFEPELFIENPDKFELGAEYEHGLLHDLVNLANEEPNDWYPVYTTGKKELGLSDDQIKVQDWPMYKQFFEKGRQTAGGVCGDNEKRAGLFTYFFACKAKFKCLDVVHRFKKRLPAECLPSEVKMKGTKRKAKTSNSQSQLKKLKCGEISCSVARPRRAGKTAALPCRICGYAIGKKSKKIKFSCCGESAHHLCWQNAGTVVSSTGECSKLASLLERDKVTAKHVYDAVETVSQPPHTRSSVTTCVDCSTEISLHDKGHTLYDCPALDRYFKPAPDEDYSTLTPLMMRSAAVVRNRIIRSTPFVPTERDTSPRYAPSMSTPRTSPRGLPLRDRAVSLRDTLLQGNPSRTAWQRLSP